MSLSAPPGRPELAHGALCFLGLSVHMGPAPPGGFES